MLRLTTQDLPVDPEQPRAGTVLTDPQVTRDLDDLLRYMDDSQARAEAIRARWQARFDWLVTHSPQIAVAWIALTILLLFVVVNHPADPCEPTDGVAAPMDCGAAYMAHGGGRP